MCCSLFTGNNKINTMRQIEIPMIKLNDGKCMPQIGFGTWLSGKSEVAESVKFALQNEYMQIDCATIYRNENQVGNGISDYMSSPGAKTRDQLYVTSKLWVKDYDCVREACLQSLKELQLEYLNLYLIHMPWEVDPSKVENYGIPGEDKVGLVGYNKERINHVWRQMEALVDEGLVKSIGVSNFSVYKLQNLLDSSPKYKPVVNQVESHPYLPSQKMYEFCKKNGITMVAYSPLGSPCRTELFQNKEEPYLLGDEIVTSIAQRNKTNNGMVLLAWAIQRGIPVIFKSTNEQRIKDNSQCLQIKLSGDDIEKLNSIKTRFRFYQNPWAIPKGEGPEFLWDGDFLS